MSEKKGSVLNVIVPHLQFELVDPPAGSTADQLRQIPYQVVTTAGAPNGKESPSLSSTMDAAEPRRRPRHMANTNASV